MAASSAYNVRMGGCVQIKDFTSYLLHPGHFMAEAARMGREHNGQLGSAAVRPISGGGLGVEVDHRRIAASPYGSHRQVQGNCRFPRSSFLADNGDGLHDTASWFAGLNVVDGGRSHRGTFASKTSIRCLGPVGEQKAVKRKRGELVPIGEVIADLPGQVQALQPSTPAQHHFTLADQVDRLVSASEADPEMGFMARLLAFCSLPRTNPGNRKAYKRVNGPFTLSMVAGAGKLLPFGNLPRLLLAWLCSEVVRMGSREIVLGASLAEFMRKLGIYSTSGKKYRSLREQMKRLFGCTISLVYSDANCEDTAATLIADRTTFWWTKPEGAVSWLEDPRKRDVLQRNHGPSGAAQHEHPQGAQAVLPRPRSVPMAHLPGVLPSRPTGDHLAADGPAVRKRPGSRQRQVHSP